MKREVDEDKLPWPYQFDSFDSEREDFERDVHLLILNSLQAGISSLRADAQRQDDKLPSDMTGEPEEYQEHVIGEAANIWGYLGDQERFMRNIALVALLSRLMHSLNKMAINAETFVPRDKDGYGNAGDDEFKQLWAEYRTRFNISVTPHIQFIDSLRVARNHIVHKGGEANPPKSLADIDLYAGDAGMYDMRFSQNYKRYVEGSGPTAMVRITQRQLDWAVKSSIKLIRYIAEQLRSKELEHVRRRLTLEAVGAGTPSTEA
jgi:hypothetical protein